MPQSAEFLAALEGEGYDFFAGVPCSLLKGVIRRFDAEPRWGYQSCVREDSAIGMAAGAWLAGRRPVVFMQNSGLGVCMNALASLNLIYEIPCLIVVSWRGEGGRDAPEHLVMGAIMDDYFRMLNMATRHLDRDAVGTSVAEITREIERTRRPGALIVSEGILDASR
jgi:phosphonopyruvate decarboxylase